LRGIAAGVALGIVSIALAAMTARDQIELRLHDETVKALNAAADALLDYAAARGRLPCPADAGSGGREPEGTDPQTGVCPTWYGFLPAAELGMTGLDPHGYKTDGWGGPLNRIRYAVTYTTVRTVTNPFTRRHGMRRVGVESLGVEYLFWVCGSADGVFEGSTCGTAPVLTSKTPVVIWSVGRNARIGGKSADEAENANPNGGSEDPVFVSRPRSATPGEEFDDIVTWLPLPLLVKRMIARGQLP
jgi:hypothetical protein